MIRVKTWTPPGDPRRRVLDISFGPRARKITDGHRFPQLVVNLKWRGP